MPDAARTATRADVRRLEPAERSDALATTVAAFATDPLLRWVWADDDRYAECAPLFFGLLLDLRRAAGEVWAADGGAAVAMWDPPGGLLATPTPDPWPPLQETFTAQERDRWAAFDAALAVPTEARPYWFLGVLATAPDRLRQGLASAALAPVLGAADRTGTDAWLETASPDNLAFYARHGFGVARESDLPGDGPTCWLLLRPPTP